jgi:hypothetical protein
MPPDNFPTRNKKVELVGRHSWILLKMKCTEHSRGHTFLIQKKKRILLETKRTEHLHPELYFFWYEIPLIPPRLSCFIYIPATIQLYFRFVLEHCTSPPVNDTFTFPHIPQNMALFTSYRYNPIQHDRVAQCSFDTVFNIKYHLIIVYSIREMTDNNNIFFIFNKTYILYTDVN